MSSSLATAITKVAEEKIRPTEEQLSAVDRETPAGQTTSTPIEDIKVGQLASRAQEGVHQAQGAKQEAQVTAGRQTHEGSEATRGQQVSEFAGQKTEQSKKIAGESAEKVRRTNHLAEAHALTPYSPPDEAHPQGALPRPARAAHWRRRLGQAPPA